MTPSDFITEMARARSIADKEVSKEKALELVGRVLRQESFHGGAAIFEEIMEQG